MKPDLGINFAGIKFKNPALTASGVFGYGYELADLIPAKFMLKSGFIQFYFQPYIFF
ncbi:MAG: hypothetical protein LE168_06205 [Endomicrobium sp.]|nr:hypothetical protein [Endomicrobium sp.]